MNTFVKSAIATICLCATAIAGSPEKSIWHIDGHKYQWQQDQLDAGLPIGLSVRMINSQSRNGAGAVTALNTNEPILSKWNGHVVALRMNNIRGGEVDATIGRIPVLDWDTWRTEHMCVRLQADGTLNDVPTPSPFAGEVGIAAWTKAGKEWATSLWMKRLQEIIHSPKSWILRENNEAGRVTHGQLWEQKKPRVKNHNNIYVWAELSTPQESYVHPDTLQPFTADWQRVDATSTIMWRWKPDGDLDATVDLRAKEWVGPRRHLYPPTTLGEFYELENAQYHALYDAFEANSAPGWQGKREGTVGYGGWDENQQNDSASSTMYFSFYRKKVLTDRTLSAGIVGNYYDWVVTYRDQCIANDAKWNELSIDINTKTSITEGAKLGQSAAIDPQAYAGYMTWLSWVLQRAGHDVRLTSWRSYLTVPTLRMFADTDLPLLESIGRPDLLPVTIGDYEVEVLRFFDTIEEHPLLSEYWDEGTTVVRGSAQNDATTVRVFATETRLPNNPRTLLTVYTPCVLSSLATIDIAAGAPGEEGYTLPVSQFAYYLTNPLEPLPAPVADTCEVEKAALQEQIDDLNAQVVALMADNGVLTTQNGELLTANADLTAQVATVQADNGVLTTQNGELLTANADLTAQVVAVQADNGALTTQNGELLAANADLTAQVAAVQAEMATLGAENLSLQAENQALLDAIQAKNAAIDLELDELDRIIQRMRDISGTNP